MRETLKAKTYAYRDNGKLLFAWIIETDLEGLIGSIGDFTNSKDCRLSLNRHLAMWSNGHPCELNGNLVIVVQ